MKKKTKKTTKSDDLRRMREEQYTKKMEEFLHYRQSLVDESDKKSRKKFKKLFTSNALEVGGDSLVEKHLDVTQESTGSSPVRPSKGKKVQSEQLSQEINCNKLNEAKKGRCNSDIPANSVEVEADETPDCLSGESGCKSRRHRQEVKEEQ